MIILALATAANAAPMNLQMPATVVRGETVTLTVEGADPGATVRILASTTLGSGPCFGPTCADVVSPLIIDNAGADGSGNVSYLVTVPGGAPQVGFFLQAVQTDAGTQKSRTGMVAVVPPTYLAGLNAMDTQSGFEIGVETPLPTMGWTALSGGARAFDLDQNGALIGETAYGNYEVEYITGDAVQPWTSYTLHVDMGFMAGIPNGVADYRLELGTSAVGGGFTSLGSAVGSVNYAGSLNFNAVSGTAQVEVVTGAVVSGDPLAVRFAQTRSAGPGTSDFFGVDNVTLRINP